MGAAIVGVVLVLGLAVALTGSIVAARAAADRAADAAALAAAPVTFRPFGATGSPRAEAARFAVYNGTQLERCVCPVDRSWAPRTVDVMVVRWLSVPGAGRLAIRSSARATFDPAQLLPQLPIEVAYER